MKRKFQITLAILEPKPNITIDFKSEILTNDIMNARDDFNIYHKDMQKLEIKAIEKVMIKAELELDVRENEQIELYRKINLFSRRLYNKYNWKQYSNLPSRLLTIVSSNEITVSSRLAEVGVNDGVIEKINVEGIDMKKEKLRYLYAEKRYVEIQIQELEQQGVTLD